MCKKILICTPGTLGQETFAKRLGLKLNSNPVVIYVLDKLSLIENLRSYTYNVVVIDFDTPDFWNISEKEEIKIFFEEIQNYQPKTTRFIGSTNMASKKQILEDINISTMHREHGMEQLSCALGLSGGSNGITIQSIQDMVAQYFKVLSEKIPQKTRKREIVQARQITMYLAKEFTSFSLKAIGEHFDGKDHTTVIHSIQTVKDLRDTDAKYNDDVSFLISQVSDMLVAPPVVSQKK